MEIVGGGVQMEMVGGGIQMEMVGGGIQMEMVGGGVQMEMVGGLAEPYLRLCSGGWKSMSRGPPFSTNIQLGKKLNYSFFLGIYRDI